MCGIWQCFAFFFVLLLFICTNVDASAVRRQSDRTFVKVFFLSNDVFSCGWAYHNVIVQQCKKAQFFLRYNSAFCTPETCVLLHTADVDSNKLPRTMTKVVSIKGGRYFSAKYALWKDYFDSLSSNADNNIYALLDLDFVFAKEMDCTLLDFHTTYVYRNPVKTTYNYSSWKRSCDHPHPPDPNDFWNGETGYVYGSAIIANRYNIKIYLQYVLNYTACYLREWDMLLTTTFAYSHNVTAVKFWCFEDTETPPILPVHIHLYHDNSFWDLLKCASDLKYTYGLLPNGFVNRTFLEECC